MFPKRWRDALLTSVALADQCATLRQSHSAGRTLKFCVVCGASSHFSFDAPDVAIPATGRLYAVGKTYSGGGTMFGNKDTKRDRLAENVALVARSAGGITQAALVRALG